MWCSATFLSLRRSTGVGWPFPTAVRDRQDGVEAPLARDVEVRLDLCGIEMVGSGLHLYKGGPRTGSPGDADQPVRVVLLVTQLERNLDERLDRSGRRTERTEQTPAKLPDGGHDRQESGSCPPFLLGSRRP